MIAPARSAAPKPPGTIDTLSSGYRIVNRHPYLLVLPVLLDLFYWLGPRLSVQPLAQQAAQAVDRAATSPLVTTGTQTDQSWAMLKDIITSLGQNLNLFSLFSSALSIPSLLSSQVMAAPGWLKTATVLTISRGSDLAWTALLLFLLGITLGATYLGLAAQVVREGRAQPGPLLRSILPYVGRFLLLALLALMVVFFVGFPVAMALGLVTLLSPMLGTILMVLVWAGMLWIYLYLFFTINAIFVSDTGPLKAIRNSVTVVRLSPSSAIGFFLTVIIISLGIPYIWSALGSSELAILLGIAGSAYVGTGLTVASMIFYRDRIVLAHSRTAPVTNAMAQDRNV